MKITNIKRVDNIFIVDLVPNRLEKFFGVQPKTKRYKDKGSYYPFGGGNVYLTEDGEETGNGSYIGTELDKWRNKF